MHFIQHVMCPDENNFHSVASLLLENLDLPQRLLVHWGRATCWSWTNWDDERVVGSDLLTLLASTIGFGFLYSLLASQTATWLYHIKDAEGVASWEDVIRSLLVKNVNAASFATAVTQRTISLCQSLE
jgi:hypothetical protein